MAEEEIVNEVVDETPQEEVQEQEVNPLDMDDATFEKFLLNEEATQEETPDEEEPGDEESPNTEEEDPEKEDPGEDSDETQSTEDTLSDKSEETSDESTAEETKTPVDPESALADLYKPFKANGKDMQVDSIEDARTLMQMGANYNKKMAAIKPNLKLLKMLENNELLDEGKLNYLIDLSKNNPDAVTKLIKDSKIDLEEIDIEEEKDYKPNTYTVNDKEVELDETLNEIRDTESYTETLNIISNKWDASSKEALLENPAGIKVLNDHVEMGVYTKVAAAVETERMLNRIPPSMSDLEAYKFVAEAINARGGFAQPQSKSPGENKVSKTTKQVVDPKLSNRKKAASSTKGSSSPKAKTNYNPLAMSDEDFEKMGMDKFL